MGRKSANALEFLKIKADGTSWGYMGVSYKSWLYRGFKQAMGKSSLQKILQIFNEVNPEETRAIPRFLGVLL